jgi:hypothetical protein
MPPRVGDIPRIKSQNPISLREVSRASAASGEKITLPEAPVGVPGSCRVAATNLAVLPEGPLTKGSQSKGSSVPLPGSGILAGFPFALDATKHCNSASSRAPFGGKTRPFNEQRDRERQKALR